MKMKSTGVRELFHRAGVTPLVRATRSQFEIDYLPPYRDPEVSIPGEVATYVVVGTLAVELLDRCGERLDFAEVR